ncbi:MAG: hypothetical protein NC041_01695 [Bacteroides sp.]|nr:hypothetical protein [Prevotella sp.]MCM1407683.1 hypothetical protein [Treponema brennaborense]MCM1469167.1 hypothetical protein [Bacteroides sp.]
MDTAVLFLTALALVILFFAMRVFFMRANSRRQKHARQTQSSQTKPPAKSGAKCPLCNSPLGANDRLLSKVYPSANGSDQRCIINGCPYCYPSETENVRRECPVCRKHVPTDGYLISRMFIKPGRKRHVHIAGCSECHKNKNGTYLNQSGNSEM